MLNSKSVMLSTRTNRLDPSLISDEQLAALARLFARPTHVALIGEHDRRTEIPKTLLDHLVRIVRLMGERKAILLVPEDEAFTTQAAANYLGMSRQHLVDLLERNEIPHYKVGTHRRITFKELLAFERRRDAERRQVLNRLSDRVDAAGLYDSSLAGEP